MLAGVWQEISTLSKDRIFVRNLALVGIITFVSSLSFAPNNGEGSVAQQNQLDRCSTTISMKLCIQTTNIKVVTK